MKFKCIYILLIVLTIDSISAHCQDSIVQKSNSFQTNAAQNSIEIKADTGIKKIKPDTSKLLVKPKKAINQFVINPKNPTLNPFNVTPVKNIYGNYTGAFLYADHFFNSTGLSINLSQHLRNAGGKDWIFYLFSSLLLFLSLLNVIFRKYFNDLFLIFFKTSMRQNQLNEQVAQAELPSLLLNIFFMVSSGLLIYFNFLYPNNRQNGRVGVEILYCIAIPTLMYFVKFVFIRTISFLFSKNDIGKIYNFNVFLVNKVAGLYFVAMAIVLAYANPAAIIIINTLTIIGLIFFIIMRLNKCYFAANQIVKISLIHFILFVISFELIPVLMVCKVLLWVIG